MKYIISALLITSGLVFLGLSQRYEYRDNFASYRVDKLTGEVKLCMYDQEDKKHYCTLMQGGTGVFKILNSDD